MKVVSKGIIFICTGLFVAAIGEIQFSIFLRNDWSNFFGSLIFNTIYLTFAAAGIAFLVSFIGKRKRTLMLIVSLYGTLGLMIEWFLIGNSPWQNPDASQMGMFAYWACMVLVPTIVLDKNPQLEKPKRKLLIYGVVYILLALLGQLLPNAELRFLYHIRLFIFGYILLLIVSFIYYWRALNAL